MCFNQSVQCTSGSSDLPLPDFSHATCRQGIVDLGNLISIMHLQVLFYFNVVHKDFHNSLTAPTKLFLSSDLICQMLPLLVINLRNASKQESVSREWATSIWIARLQRHVNMTQLCFDSFRLLQIAKGPNKSTPQ